MKARLSLILLQLLLAAQLHSQTPTPEPTADFVVAAGHFRKPGLVSYTYGMKLLAAVSAAGEYDEFADVKTIYLIRCGKKEAINLQRLRTGQSEEPILQPWDIVYLPEGFW